MKTAESNKLLALLYCIMKMLEHKSYSLDFVCAANTHTVGNLHSDVVVIIWELFGFPCVEGQTSSAVVGGGKCGKIPINHQSNSENGRQSHS